jgi:hypothetical protein
VELLGSASAVVGNTDDVVVATAASGEELVWPNAVAGNAETARTTARITNAYLVRCMQPPGCYRSKGGVLQKG